MLNDEQKELVKNTVPVLKENGVALTDYFYRRMLKNNPDLKETLAICILGLEFIHSNP